MIRLAHESVSLPNRGCSPQGLSKVFQMFRPSRAASLAWNQWTLHISIQLFGLDIRRLCN